MEQQQQPNENRFVLVGAVIGLFGGIGLLTIIILVLSFFGIADVDARLGTEPTATNVPTATPLPPTATPSPTPLPIAVERSLYGEISPCYGEGKRGESIIMFTWDATPGTSSFGVHIIGEAPIYGGSSGGHGANYSEHEFEIADDATVGLHGPFIIELSMDGSSGQDVSYLTCFLQVK